MKTEFVVMVVLTILVLLAWVVPRNMDDTYAKQEQNIQALATQNMEMKRQLGECAIGGLVDALEKSTND